MSSFIEMRDGRWVNRNCIVCVDIAESELNGVCSVDIRTNALFGENHIPFRLVYSFDTKELAEAELMRIIGKELDA